jgi:hypothetical protein
VLGHSRLEGCGHAEIADALVSFAENNVDVEELQSVGLPAVVSRCRRRGKQKARPPSLITAGSLRSPLRCERRLVLSDKVRTHFEPDLSVKPIPAPFPTVGNGSLIE